MSLTRRFFLQVCLALVLTPRPIAAGILRFSPLYKTSPEPFKASEADAPFS